MSRSPWTLPIFAWTPLSLETVSSAVQEPDEAQSTFENNYFPSISRFKSSSTLKRTRSAGRAFDSPRGLGGTWARLL